MVKVKVRDKMQKNYFYELDEPAGKNFDPEFRPDLTPKEMLKLGIFGGVYMRDCTKEFPKDWFLQAKFAPASEKKHLASLNFFKTNASQPLKVWRKKGWIHKDDPRGWFQWYCRYWMGRRHADDARQIRRWKNMKRHVVWLTNACKRKDLKCRPRQRQALLHWAYDSRKL